MTPITILNLGMGNLGSLSNMFRRLEVPSMMACAAGDVRAATKLVLPGVGAFDAAMGRIRAVPGLLEALEDRARIARIPILGICLGMQVLTDGSDEGAEPGLGWIPGRATRFSATDGLKVPHMGWNDVDVMAPSPLTSGLPEGSRFYFVHSYFVRAKNHSDVLLRSRHGCEFDSGIGRDNVFGVQFHPEKSHRFGLALLRNFANL